MAYLELTRPATLDDTEWTALVQLVDRIVRAHQNADWQLVVGSAKELCEAVAKQIVEARGEVVASSAKYDALLTKAHRLLDRQPGEGLAMDPPVREMATAAKRISIEVGSLRRTYGTGHGRVVPADTIAEHAELAVDAAVLWCRWALRRLDFIVEGRAVDLLRDLRQGTFHQGDLRRRLIAADLSGLSPDEQRRLGIAVGRRASRRTFNVLNDGLRAAAEDGPWTDDYRQGVIEGTFTDDDGYIRVTGPSVGAAMEVLRVMEPDVALAVVGRIGSAMFDADLSYAITAADLAEARQSLEQASEHIGPFELRMELKVIASQLKHDGSP